MAIAARLRYADLESIPEEHPGDRHELINGELIVTPVPIMKHQIVSGNIIFLLDTFARDRGAGRVLPAPTGIRLTPDNLLIPDVLFVAADRLHVIGPKTVDAAPDLVVEILSPGTRQRDLTVKRALYARFGVREYWIVDPEARTIQLLTLAGDVFAPVKPDEDGVLRSQVLPELLVDGESVFAGV